MKSFLAHNQQPLTATECLFQIERFIENAENHLMLASSNLALAGNIGSDVLRLQSFDADPALAENLGKRLRRLLAICHADAAFGFTS